MLRFVRAFPATGYLAHDAFDRSDLSPRTNPNCEAVSAPKTIDRFEFERALWSRGVTRVAGVDEAGRGPLAGPVVAAAVIFPPECARSGFDERLRDLNDSKQLTERQRDDFFSILTANSEIRFAIALVDANTIDQLNILQATHHAMNEALGQLQPQPSTCWWTAGRCHPCHCPTRRSCRATPAAIRSPPPAYSPKSRAIG